MVLTFPGSLAPTYTQKSLVRRFTGNQSKKGDPHACKGKEPRTTRQREPVIVPRTKERKRRATRKCSTGKEKKDPRPKQEEVIFAEYARFSDDGMRSLEEMSVRFGQLMDFHFL